MGFGLAAGLLAGLVVSVNVGLFGFTESLRAPFVIESIALEVAGAASLATWVGLDLLQQTRDPRRRFHRQRPLIGAEDIGIASFTRRRRQAKMQS